MWAAMMPLTFVSSMVMADSVVKLMMDWMVSHWSGVRVIIGVVSDPEGAFEQYSLGKPKPAAMGGLA
jgi:steroid 5-alpha reductase family enzyme